MGRLRQSPPTLNFFLLIANSREKMPNIYGAYGIESHIVLLCHFIPFAYLGTPGDERGGG